MTCLAHAGKHDVDVLIQNGYKWTVSVMEVWMTDRENTLLFGLLAVAGVLCGLDPALADTASTTGGTAVFTTVQAKASEIFTNIRNILMIVGAIGVLGLATMAFFGKFKWSWAVSLLGGLMLIAVVGQVVQYFVGANSVVPS